MSQKGIDVERALFEHDVGERIFRMETQMRQQNVALDQINRTIEREYRGQIPGSGWNGHCAGDNPSNVHPTPPFSANMDDREKGEH